MNRNEFLRELQNALENSMGEASVRENVRYYSEYIEDEVKKGRSEEEVIEELGDPWLIVKTLSDAPGGSQSYDAYESSDGSYVREKKNREQNNNVHVFNFDKKWKIILLIVALVAAMLLIFSILTGIIALLTPVLVPVLMIVIVIRILSNRNR